MTDIEQLLAHKELGYCDYGSVKMVRPTGRYIETNDPMDPAGSLNRLRYSVEVKDGLFGKSWVPAHALRPIQTKGQS